MKFFDQLFLKEKEHNYYGINGLTNELEAIYVYNTYLEKKKSILVVANTLYEANNVYNRIATYTNNTLFFPMDDFITSEAIAISPELKAERINTLNKLSLKDKYIVVTNLTGLLRYLPNKKTWISSKLELKNNMDIKRDDLINKLIELGYTRETLVTETGKFGIRGYVIDIFPIGYDNPIRIEFWSDTIESIKYFDINTQMSIKEVDSIIIDPYTEFITKENNELKKEQKYLINYEDVMSISAYLDNEICFYYDYPRLLNSYQMLFEKILEYKEESKEQTNYMFDIKNINNKQEIFFMNVDNIMPNLKKEEKYISSNIDNYENNYQLLKENLDKQINNKKTVILCINDKNIAKRIVKYLDKDDLILTNESEIISNKINIINKSITNGFIYNDYYVLSTNDLFKNDQVKIYKSKYKIGIKISNINNIIKGDYVVHEIYGIGLYDELVTLTKNGLKKDYIKLIYAGGDILYVPVENISRISKFSGKEGIVLKLSRLNSDDWKQKKAKVRSKIEDIAANLIKVSAQREAMKGYAFSEDDENQIMFDNEFNYTPTPDQINAINNIKAEMQKNKPMDMLLCGDVGYGKTEVAFRAIFKAVNDGKQVAYLCPTTILSNQQYNNALERFKQFPINIALLNRFVDSKKQQQIINDLKEGKIDILFGTHRILSSDIEFKDLGLLVVDEEQRFGVKHKEKIKEYKSNIDVLTLSATPIPRTLQMSIAGIRSLSLIETPPEERYPIQTYVLEENDNVVKDAIYKELSRKGQIFILYNRVESIERKVEEIQKLVPEARIVFAHGQMTKDSLEKKMMDFINYKFDVLVCTTIIETGIDIPNVNTLIVYNADYFGLSQLYQIRGRIGRSNKIGYSYLMYDKRKMLNDIAIKRLNTIKEFTELGSGFKIAMRDLSIRGAGDILGSEQSGFIDSIGIELYLKMLKEAVSKLKGEVLEEQEVDTKPLIEVDTHISDEYINDEDLKIEIHKKINEVDSFDKMQLVTEELEDRFGKINKEIEIYMLEEWFEKLASKLKIINVKQTKTYIEIELPEEISKQIDGEKLFFDAYEISKMFRFNYKNNKIYIILDLVKLEKHYLFYLINILEKITSYLN